MDKHQEQARIKELIGEKPKGFHWWDDSPTSALVISWVFGWVLSIVLFFLIDNPIVLLIDLLLVILQVYVVWWYLKAKNRDRWLTLLAFVPFGFWILVFLQDKTLSR